MIKKVPHPGSACCDPGQDLAGWVARETAHLERVARVVKVLHQRGARLRREGTRAFAKGDARRGVALDAQSVAAHGLANAHAQSALIRSGHLERVIAAHQWRLGVDTPPGPCAIVVV